MLFFIISILYSLIILALFKPLKQKNITDYSNFLLNKFFVRFYLLHLILFSIFIYFLVHDNFIFEFNKHQNIQYLLIAMELILVVFFAFFRNRATPIIGKLFLVIDVIFIIQL